MTQSFCSFRLRADRSGRSLFASASRSLRASAHSPYRQGTALSGMRNAEPKSKQHLARYGKPNRLELEPMLRGRTLCQWQLPLQPTFLDKENRFRHQNRVVALPFHQSFCQNCLLKSSGDKYCLYWVHSGLAIWFMAASPPLNILRLLFFPGEI